MPALTSKGVHLRIRQGVILALLIASACGESGEDPRLAERKRHEAVKVRADSIAADSARAARAFADSLLQAVSPATVRTAALRDLARALASATPGVSPTGYQLVRAEQTRRLDSVRAGAQAANEKREQRERAVAVMVAARTVTTGDGGRCTRATEARARDLARRYPGWSSEALATVMCGAMVIGMTGPPLRASWGAPERINRTVVRSGTREQWVYSRTYVYLEEGVVVSWQDSR